VSFIIHEIKMMLVMRISSLMQNSSLDDVRNHTVNSLDKQIVNVTHIYYGIGSLDEYNQYS